MKIRCLHGFYIFEETASGQAARFTDLVGLNLVRDGNLWTFEGLVGAPKHSVAGGTYLGAPCTKTFEGQPWEVMKKNSLVFNPLTDTVQPIASVVATASISTSINYYVSNGLLIAGSRDSLGAVIESYSGFFVFDTAVFKYSEIQYG